MLGQLLESFTISSPLRLCAIFQVYFVVKAIVNVIVDRYICISWIHQFVSPSNTLIQSTDGLCVEEHIRILSYMLIRPASRSSVAVLKQV